MKKQFALFAQGTGALALALLSGCSLNNGTSTSASTTGPLTISGTASAAARQSVVVANASDSTIGKTTTDLKGAFEVGVDTTNIKFPLTITVIRDSDTIVTVIPAPDSLHVRHIEANVTDLTKFAAGKIKGDSTFKKLTQAKWDSTLAASSDEWAQKADSTEHHKGVLNFAVCSDTAALASLDSLKAKELNVEAVKDSLKSKLDSGAIDPQTFIKKIDSAFVGLRGKAERGPRCEPRFPGAEHVFAQPDSGIKFDSLDIKPFPAALPACSDSVATALKASFDTLLASYKAGTITEDAFLAALKSNVPTCAVIAPISAQHPVPVTGDSIKSRPTVPASSSSVEAASSSAAAT